APTPPPNPAPCRAAGEPFRPDLVVGCECMHSWYWLADTCRQHNIPFALGHAFGIKAVHASKTKSDAHDAEILARLRAAATSHSPTPTRVNAAGYATCSAPDCDSSAN